MPCAYASTFRAGQPWDKPGHDGEGGAHQRPDGYPAAFAPGLGVTKLRNSQAEVSPKCHSFGELRFGRRDWGDKAARI
jgi:hypothetical protein